MVYCQKCGAENEDNAVYCHDCGSKLNVKISERVVENLKRIKKKNTHKKYYIVFGAIIFNGFSFSICRSRNNAQHMFSNMLIGGGFVLFFVILILVIALKNKQIFLK